MDRFWHWVHNRDGTRTLYMDGVIASESWLGYEITPAAFKAELCATPGPVTIYLNSPGGDCVAASQIYTMLMEYPADVDIIIDGIAASAASVIAMAGTSVQMAPTAIMMLHRPLTVAMGNTDDMQRAIAMLEEYKEAILNAYEIKTDLPRATLSEMMDAETWLSARKAVELGFADGILERGQAQRGSADGDAGGDPPGAVAYTACPAYAYSGKAAAVIPLHRAKPPDASRRTGTPAADLERRLGLLR